MSKAIDMGCAFFIGMALMAFFVGFDKLSGILIVLCLVFFFVFGTIETKKADSLKSRSKK